MATKIPRFIRQALEFSEDTYWAKQANIREMTFRRKRALSHKRVWG